MKSYTLVFMGGDPELPLRLEFDVSDPASLFAIAERPLTGRSAQLWDGGRLIGKISRSESGLWCIDPTGAMTD